MDGGGDEARDGAGGGAACDGAGAGFEAACDGAEEAAGDCSGAAVPLVLAMELIERSRFELRSSRNESSVI